MAVLPMGSDDLRERPPTSFCIDYGHHGRERCVFCGLKRPAASTYEEGPNG